MQRILLAVGAQDSKLVNFVKEHGQKNSKLVEFEVLASAVDVRCALVDGSYDEVWVFSSNDMGPINLAAALAKTKTGIPIYASFEKDTSELDKFKGELVIQELLPKSELEDLLFKKLNEITNENKTEDLKARDSIDDVSNGDPAIKAIETSIDVSDELENMFEPDEPSELSGVYGCASPQNSIETSIKVSDKAKKSAFILSVMSGGGGVGKSTTVATASYLAASKGFSVIVVDCDLQFGDMHQLMGEVPCTSVDDILINESLFEAFAKSCNRDIPALICAPKRLERSEELTNHLDEILDLCASLFDVVFINTGSSWSEVNAQLIEKSSCNLFMIDQRASSVRACQHAIDLCMRMGLATGQFIYALNRCDRNSLFCATDVANAMHGVNVVELKDGGQEVEELLGMGLAGELAASKNDFTNSLNSMLAEVLP